jgi:alkylation response protein AidB-like acyl-CoA dehydrogenase
MTDPVADRTATYVERARRLAPLVHEHAERAERTAQLPVEVAEAFHQAGLFRMLLAVEMGGGGLTIPASLRVIEEVARLDGSAGWNLAICSGGPLFGHFISHDAFDEIFSDPQAVIAGSLNPTTTRVESCDGDWRFSGKASYVSGSAQASWLMAAGLARGAVLALDGTPHVVSAQARLLDVGDPAGRLLIREEEVPREGVVVRRTYQAARWHDGRLFVWAGNRASVGRGEASSGLAFDALDG